MQTKLFNYFCKISLCLCCCTNSMETKNTKSSNVEAKSEKTKERSNNVIRLTFVIVLWDSLLYTYIYFFKGKWICCDFLCVCSSFQWGSFNSSSFAQFFTILILFHTYIYVEQIVY